eukprot:1546038-Lingulodinium_polyedra.AAC.1
MLKEDFAWARRQLPWRGLPEPADLGGWAELARAKAGALRGVAAAAARAATALREAELPPHQARREIHEALKEAGAPLGPPPQPLLPWRCADCQSSFATLQALRAHAARRHLYRRPAHAWAAGS